MWEWKYPLVIFILLVNSCSGSRRTLYSELNPGCGGKCAELNVTTFYLRAEGPTDTLHYLWDFVQRPAILLAITSNSAKLNVSWDDYLINVPKSIRFTEEPEYTFGVSIEKVLEFDDTNDNGHVDTVLDQNINVLNPENFRWSRKSQQSNDKFVELHMNGENYSDTVKNITRRGNIRVVLNGFCTLEHSDVMPHMLHSENSTQVDFILENLETNKTFTKSRFGMELLVVSQESPLVRMSIDAKKSLDDEHTPGIFEVVELRTPWKMINKGMEEAEAYLQWRPVSYTTSHRDVTSSTDVIHYQLRNCSNIDKKSILYAYYGDQRNDLLMEKINITIGSSGDGFYTKTNYSTWTFIVGYGTPPDEQFSYLVIMIISIGVGLPMLIMSVAAFYACIRRLRNS
ncbi:glycosylated lysosomal membrane protein-like [Diachasmimorpha longicaudata]|uniref:glycosylated lysosomal membrane protein-like n=1 Tax=Diachasmimorpha longicaudata TaxID=58733 RepID=UPI0030B8F1D0